MKQQTIKVLVKRQSLSDLNHHLIKKFATFNKEFPESDSIIKFCGSSLEDLDKNNVAGWVTISCPHCNYKRSTPVFKTIKYKHKQPFFGPSWWNRNNLNFLAKQFLFHIESRVRLSGSQEHIKMIQDLFGEKYTKTMVSLWHKKALKAIKNMEKYLNE